MLQLFIILYINFIGDEKKLYNENHM